MENRLVRVEFELGIEKKKRTEELTGSFFSFFFFSFWIFGGAVFKRAILKIARELFAPVIARKKFQSTVEYMWKERGRYESG